MGIVPISLKLRDARERRALVMAKGPEVVWRWKGQVTLASLWWSWVPMTHWAWDRLWALPAWGKASLPQLRLPLSHCPSCPAALHLLCTLQAVASAAQASLLRQQEELDRKAAELERKERELQNTVANLHGREAVLPGLRLAEPACSRAASELS